MGAARARESLDKWVVITRKETEGHKGQVQGRGRCSLVYSITMEDAEQQQNEAEVRSSRPGKATRAAQAKKEADQRRALNTIIDMVESRLNTGPKNGSGLRWEDEVSAGAFDETSLAQYCKMSVGTPIIHLFIQFFPTFCY